MTILTLSNCDLTESQGSGYVIANFARGLAVPGHAVRTVAPDDCILWQRQNKARFLRLALGWWGKAAKLLQEVQPDIVEFYGGVACWATDRLSRMEGRRFKIVAHSNGIEPFFEETLARHGLSTTGDGQSRKWYQKILRLPVEKAFSKADGVVTVSYPEAEYAIRRGFQPADRVLAIENALGEDFLDQPLVGERPNTIGYCGAWLARKGVELLATDLTTVLLEAPGWTLHLVGVGDGFQPSAHFAADVLPRIQVTGFVADKAEQRRIYQSWAIALMPSIYESFGLAAAEAMSCGCALVANRTGFAATLVDGREALLLTEAVSPHLRRAILRLIHDDSLRRRLGEAGRKRFQSLRWAESISKIEAFYLQLSGRANGGSDH